MSEDSRYFWVVLCKNHWFHVRRGMYFSGTESHLPRQTPSPLALLSIAASGSDAMSAAKSICINPQKC